MAQNTISKTVVTNIDPRSKSRACVIPSAGYTGPQSLLVAPAVGECEERGGKWTSKAVGRTLPSVWGSGVPVGFRDDFADYE